MNEMLPITVSVNRQPNQSLVSGQETLLSFLRDQMHLTGTKRGCNQGVCGACTVLVDGVPMRSCLSVAALCDGAEITTVEGLAKDGELSPIQQAFHDHGAVQCGFCTSGILMTIHAYLAENPNPTVDDVRQALAGNLCRCSGYKKIVDAILAAVVLIKEEAGT